VYNRSIFLERRKHHLYNSLFPLHIMSPSCLFFLTDGRSPYESNSQKWSHSGTRELFETDKARHKGRKAFSALLKLEKNAKALVRGLGRRAMRLLVIQKPAFRSTPFASAMSERNRHNGDRLPEYEKVDM
jgi:hypothetical protein